MACRSHSKMSTRLNATSSIVNSARRTQRLASLLNAAKLVGSSQFFFSVYRFLKDLLVTSHQYPQQYCKILFAVRRLRLTLPFQPPTSTLCAPSVVIAEHESAAHGTYK